jgi:hypothetical protein
MAAKVNGKVNGKEATPLTKVDQILERMRQAAGVYNNKQLSEFLGLDPQATTSAKKHGTIPARWLVLMAEHTTVSMDWLLYGDPEEPAPAPREAQGAFPQANLRLTPISLSI